MMNLLFASALFLLVSQSYGQETVTGDESIPQAAPPAESCKPLAPGASQSVLDVGSNSPTGVARAYRVTRDSSKPDTYTVELPLKFQVDFEAVVQRYGISSVTYMSPNDRPAGRLQPGETNTGRNLELKTAEANQAVAAQVASCFKSMEGKLYDSQGTKINFKLDTKNSLKMVVDSTVANRRSHSSAWARDIECPTIMHESLHWLGLVDGYDGQNDNFGCRSVEPDSMMGNHWTALGPHYDILYCGMSPGSPKIVEEVPSLVDAIIRCEPSPMEPFQDTVNQAQFDFFQANPQFLIGSAFYVKRAGTPNLLPAHTRMITQPTCNRVNQKYITCAQNAYRGVGNCENVPSYCIDESYLK